MCGKNWHFLINCEETKKHLKVLKQLEKAVVQASAQRTPKDWNRKGIRMHLTEVEEESGTDYKFNNNFGDSKPEAGTKADDEEKEETIGIKSLSLLGTHLPMSRGPCPKWSSSPPSLLGPSQMG